MKTEKFTIQTEGTETLITNEIKISKKVYMDNLRKLTAQVEETKNKEFYVESYHTMNETTKLYISQYRFSCGSTDVYLTHYKCKEGYQFK